MKYSTVSTNPMVNHHNFLHQDRWLAAMSIHHILNDDTPMALSTKEQLPCYNIIKLLRIKIIVANSWLYWNYILMKNKNVHMQNCRTLTKHAIIFLSLRPNKCYIASIFSLQCAHSLAVVHGKMTSNNETVYC